MTQNGTLETLPEDYQQFSFQQNFGKYKANIDFLQIDNNPDPKAAPSLDTFDNGNGNSQRSFSDLYRGSVIQNTFSKNIGTVNRKDPFNSSKFDNLQSILDMSNNQGTVVHQADSNKFDTTKVRPSVVAENEKENAPLWMRQIQMLKAQNLKGELNDVSNMNDYNRNHNKDSIFSVSRKTGTRSSSDSATSNTQASSLNYVKTTPDSSVNRSPSHTNIEEKIIQPITQSTAVSTYNSRPATAKESSKFNSVESGQQSPLKLFSGDNYNTYTQQRFDNLIGQYNPSGSDSYNSHQNINRNTENLNSDDQTERQESIRIRKKTTKSNIFNMPPSRSGFRAPLGSINESPSDQSSPTSIKKENNGNFLQRQAHSRASSLSKDLGKSLEGSPQSVKTNNTKQIDDYLLFANNVFNNVIKRGPGVSSKESLNAQKLKSEEETKQDYSEPGSYTSDDLQSFENQSGEVRMDQKSQNYDNFLNSLNIKNGQGILRHPNNPQVESPKLQTIQDVTNNMSTFDTIQMKRGVESQGSYEHGSLYTNSYSQELNSEYQQNEEAYDNSMNDTTNITHHFMESFIEPKIKNFDPFNQKINEHSKASSINNKYILNEQDLEESQLEGLPQDASETNYDYDINASFMNEISEPQQNTNKSNKNAAGSMAGKSSLKKVRGQNVTQQNKHFADKNRQQAGKVNFKKLLKFAPGEVEIPEKMHGMVFDKNQNKWIKESRMPSAKLMRDRSVEKSISVENESSGFTSSRDDENVHALNAIADLSIASRNQSSYDSSYVPSENVSNTQSNTDFIASNNTTNNNTLANNDITFNQLPNVSNISQIETTFSTSKRQLVSTLTDVLPKNKNWDLVKEVNLSNRNLSSLVDFETLLPNLRTVNVNRNVLRNFEGLPTKVDNISAQSNKLNGLLSLKSFQDLEILDVADNFFQTLTTFKNLVHLRYLNVSSNLVNNINSLNNSSFQYLMVLDLSNNFLRGVINLKRFRYLQNLQELNLSNNYIDNIDGVKFLPNLILLKADNNLLKDFTFDLLSSDESSYHRSLKKLSLRNNSLQSINLSHFKNLRVLRVNNKCELFNLSKLHKLDELLINGAYEATKNFASSNFDANVLKQVAEYNTVKTLNVTNMGITSLNISQYLALESLYCLFNHIDNFQKLVEDIKYLTNLKRIDLRFNPITIEFYEVASKNHLMNIYYDKDILKQDEALEDDDLEFSQFEEELDMMKRDKASIYRDIFKGELQKNWEENDDKFVENLKVNNVSAYRKRIYYQGLILTMFRKLKYLDGILVTREKRDSIVKEFEQFFK